MNVFNFLRNPLGEALNQVVKSANTISDARDRLRSYVQIIKGSWIGGDEEAFEQEVQTVLIPMVVDYINALMGINTNTSKAADIMDRADSQAKSIVGQVRDAFQNI